MASGFQTFPLTQTQGKKLLANLIAATVTPANEIDTRFISWFQSLVTKVEERGQEAGGRSQEAEVRGQEAEDRRRR
jgi:hypothetical protein